MILEEEKLDILCLLRPIIKYRGWLYLAYTTIVYEYKRTILGPIWILLNLIIFVFAVGYVYSGIFDIKYFEYLSYMTSGMIGWLWAGSILTNSGLIYQSHLGLISSSPVNKSYLIWSQAFYNFIIFLHQIPLLFCFYLAGKIELSFNLLFLIPTLILVFLLNVGVGAALSVIINRYRDIQKILTSFVVVIMVTTPIFWQPGMITGVRKLVYLLNPFYYIVEAVRQPMLGQFDLKIFLILLTLSMSSLIVGTYFHVKYSKSVIFRL
tara:strand:+ start:246 stop:1040 length:795 start_codon:yes stop_codon:yes gene_type:complete